MSDEIVARVARSARYRDVDPALLARLTAQEVQRGGSPAEVAKRVKRRLHQAVGAFRGASHADRVLAPIRAAWVGDLADPAFRRACASALERHASTRERVPHLDALYPAIWRLTDGPPRRVMDLACGMGPLALPWMGLARDASYLACDADARPLTVVEEFLALVRQPAAVAACDLVAGPPRTTADVALLLKTVPTLDRQEPAAAERLVRSLRVRHLVVSFPRRSLSGRGRGMERTYRARLERLAAEAGATAVAEASIANELIFVLALGRG